MFERWLCSRDELPTYPIRGSSHYIVQLLGSSVIVFMRFMAFYDRFTGFLFLVFCDLVDVRVNYSSDAV